MLNCLNEKIAASTTSNRSVGVMPGMMMWRNNWSALAPSARAAS